MTTARLPPPPVPGTAAVALVPARGPALALLLASLGGVALAVAAAPLAAAGWPWAGAVKWLFHGVCHQLPERSFHWFGWPLAVCHRCTGLYLGFLAGVALWPAVPARLRRLAVEPRWLALCLALPVVDWALPNTPASRVATGFVAALPLGLLALMALPSGQHRPSRNKQ